MEKEEINYEEIMMDERTEEEIETYEAEV